MLLHVATPGAVLTRREGRLQVVLDGSPIADVGTANLEAVLLWGANATVPALRLLLAREIPLVLFDSRGRYRGRLEPPWSGHALLRDRQRETFRSRRVELVRALVARKLLNQATVLERWARRGHRQVRPTVERLRSLARGLRTLEDPRGPGHGSTSEPSRPPFREASNVRGGHPGIC